VRNQLSLFYQPRIDLATAEALFGWLADRAKRAHGSPAAGSSSSIA
jgi:hypothetical protein